jgi:two-component sensor histidine kinase
VLVREKWEGAGLGEIVAEALAAYSSGNGHPARLQFRGPELRLQPKAALAMSMALHELATNAVKHGALSNGTGSVSIIWQTRDEQQDFEFQWTECGGPQVTAPRRRGFGSRLIEQGLSQDLGGEVRLEFEASGVVCRMHAPLHEIAWGWGQRPNSLRDDRHQETKIGPLAK